MSIVIMMVIMAFMVIISMAFVVIISMLDYTVLFLADSKLSFMGIQEFDICLITMTSSILSLVIQRIEVTCVFSQQVCIKLIEKEGG